MAVSAIVKDGQLLETASQKSVSSASATSSTSKTENNGYDKDSFLQLLVAQMKYQDPLEPTSNTEYISQYATFSQVEQLQNMASTMDLSRASGYVGQMVQISSTDSKGETTIVEGVVDYVKYENQKAYVSIDGELYSADDITAVIDSTYNTAVEIANAFAEAINRLPSLANLTTADIDKVNALSEGYDAMTSYQQSFIDQSYVDLLKEYYQRCQAMVADQKAAAEAEAEKSKNEESKAEKDSSDAGINEMESKIEEVSPTETVTSGTTA